MLTKNMIFDASDPVKLYAKSGEVNYQTSKNIISLTKDDAIVQINAAKADIVDCLQNGNNLEIYFSNKEPLIIENFFQSGDINAHKLLIEDGEQLYVSSYNEPFTGINFAQVDDMSQALNSEPSSSSVSWILPLAGLAAVGGIIAVAASNKSGDSSDSHSHGDNSGNNSNAKQGEIDKATSGLQVSLTTIQHAHDALKNAMSNLKGSTTEPSLRAFISQSNTLTADKSTLLEAKTQLETLLDSYKSELANLEQLINEAVDGIDYTNAKQILESANALTLEIAGDLTQAEAAIEIAESIIDELTSAQTILSHNVIDSLITTINQAKTDPSAENIETAKIALINYQQYINDVQQSQETLLQTQDNAVNNQFIDTKLHADINALLEDLNTLLADHPTTQNTLEEALAKALENQQIVSELNEKIDAAKTAIANANEEYAIAVNALKAAEQALQDAVANNQVNNVAAINTQIEQANALLAAAQESIVHAQDLHADAQNKLDEAIHTHGIDADFSELHALDTLPNYDEISAITVHLEANPMDSVFDIIGHLIKDGLVYAQNLFGKWIESPLLNLIKDFANGIVDSVLFVIDNIWQGVIVTPIHEVVGAIKGIVAECIDLGIDVLGVIKSSIVDFGALFVSLITDVGVCIANVVPNTIKDIMDLGILGWMNPNAWIPIIGYNVAKMITQVIATVATAPIKIFNIFVAKLGDVSSDIKDKIVNSIKVMSDAIDNIVSSISHALINNPYEQFIKPVVDTIVGFIKDPIGSIHDIITKILVVYDDMLSVIKDLIHIPIDIVNAIIEAVNDIIISIKDGAEVIIVDDILDLQIIDNLELDLTDSLSRDGDSDMFIDDITSLNLDDLLSLSGDETIQIAYDQLEELVSDVSEDIDLDQILIDNDGIGSDTDINFDDVELINHALFDNAPVEVMPQVTPVFADEDALLYVA